MAEDKRVTQNYLGLLLLVKVQPFYVIPKSTLLLEERIRVIMLGWVEAVVFDQYRLRRSSIFSYFLNI